MDGEQVFVAVGADITDKDFARFRAFKMMVQAEDEEEILNNCIQSCFSSDLSTTIDPVFVITRNVTFNDLERWKKWKKTPHPITFQ